MYVIFVLPGCGSKIPNAKVIFPNMHHLYQTHYSLISYPKIVPVSS
jgi:hypothetical protein